MLLRRKKKKFERQEVIWANVSDHFPAQLKLNPLKALAPSRDCSRSCIPPTAVANTSKIDAWLQILVLLERGLIIRM